MRGFTITSRRQGVELPAGETRGMGSPRLLASRRSCPWTPTIAPDYAQNPRAVSAWQSLPIGVRSPIGQSLAVFGRSPSMPAEKNAPHCARKGEWPDLRCRFAVGAQRAQSAATASHPPRRSRMVMEDRQRRARTSDQSRAGALARRHRGVLVARLRLVAGKILASAFDGAPRHGPQAE